MTPGGCLWPRTAANAVLGRVIASCYLGCGGLIRSLRRKHENPNHWRDAPSARQGSIMSRRDWLLVALTEAGDRGLSPVQIQKTMFLFKNGTDRVLDEDQFYDFRPYNYGPFDSQIYRDLEDLAM